MMLRILRKGGGQAPTLEVHPVYSWCDMAFLQDTLKNLPVSKYLNQCSDAQCPEGIQEDLMIYCIESCRQVQQNEERWSGNSTCQPQGFSDRQKGNVSWTSVWGLSSCCLAGCFVFKVEREDLKENNLFECFHSEQEEKDMYVIAFECKV